MRATVLALEAARRELAQLRRELERLRSPPDGTPDK
jgi:hypothetical protein